MNQHAQITTISEDEIDLRELLATIKDGWKILVATISMAILMAGAYLYITPPTYSESLLIRMPIAGNATSNINNIAQTLLAEKQKESGFYTFELSKTQPSNMLSVNVLVNNPADFIKAQTDLLVFLNENKSIKPLLQKAEADTRKLIAQIDTEYAKNLQIKDIVKSQVLSSKSATVGFNPLSMDTVLLDITEKKSAYETALANIGVFELVTPPITPTKPIKPKPALTMSVSIVTGVILGMFLVFVVQFFRGAKDAV